MGFTTAGTFADDAESIGMNGADIQMMIEAIRTIGEKGTALYEFGKRKYGVKWQRRAGDIELLSITPL